MPNATVRANARTLPETSRRAILGAVLAAGAIGAIPIAVEAAPAPPPRLAPTPSSSR